MSKSKHTPGPWRVIKERNPAPQYNTTWTLDSETRKCMAVLTVLDLNKNPKWRTEHPDKVIEHAETVVEVAANARLIAAAPELLAALEAMVAAYAPRHAECPESMLHSAVRAAAAAISKAKGGGK